MSPELVAQGIDEYLKSLEAQAKIAEAFYFGRIEEGMEGLLQLPQELGLKVDQLIWEEAGGEVLDPTEDHSKKIIAAAVIQALEQRMGFS